MPAPLPVVIPRAFAQNAAGIYRNTIPDAPIGTQRASWDLGFPPLTMTPEISGGLPMLGPDMQGVLYALSSHAVYAQGGEAYKWNADVVVALAGYGVGTMLGSTDGLTLWFNTLPANNIDPETPTPPPTGTGWVPMYSYGMTVMPPTNGGIVTLTDAQASKSVIVLSGILAGNLQIVLPNSVRRWLIVNTCVPGAYTVTVRTAAGTGVEVSAGGFAAPTEVYGDGTNLYYVIAPTVIPGDVAPTPNTFAVRSNVGYLYATYFNSTGPAQDFDFTEVFAGAGDGFIRKIPRGNFLSRIFTNPAFTGVPTAPTAPPATSDMQLATTAFANPGQSLALNGYIKFAGGGILQWGTVNYAGGSDTRIVPNVPFPLPFPTAVLAVVPVNFGSNNCFIEVSARNAINASYRVDQRENGGNFGAGAFTYIAVGF